MSDEALALIRDLRHDPTIQKNQVGLLDSTIAAIENLKRMYDSYLAELKAEQAAGTLTEDEKFILDGETYGYPTPEPEDESVKLRATQACELFKATAIANATAYPATRIALQATIAAYPEPATPTPETGMAYPLPGGADPIPDVIPCPTAIPTPIPVRAPYRSADPDTLPPEEFEIQIYSVEIEGDIARSVVYKWGVTTEYVLIKVNGQWYIAGMKLLKVSI